MQLTQLQLAAIISAGMRIMVNDDVNDEMEIELINRQLDAFGIRGTDAGKAVIDRAIEMKTEEESQIFAGFSNELKEYASALIASMVEIDSKITLDEVDRWIELCQAYQLPVMSISQAKNWMVKFLGL